MRTNLPSAQVDRHRKEGLDEDELELVTGPDQRRIGETDANQLQGHPQAAWFPRGPYRAKSSHSQELPIQSNV